MKEVEIAVIAKFIRRIVIDKENTSIIVKEASEFRKDSQKVHYCFESFEI